MSKFQKFFENKNNKIIFPYTSTNAKNSENLWSQFPHKMFVDSRKHERKTGTPLEVTIQKGTFLYHGTTSKLFADDPTPHLNFKTFFGFFPAVGFWFAFRDRTKTTNKEGYLIQFETTEDITLKIIGTVVNQAIQNNYCINTKNPKDPDPSHFDGCTGKMIVTIRCQNKIKDVSQNDFIEFVLKNSSLYTKIKPVRSFKLDLNIIDNNCKNPDFDFLTSISSVYKQYEEKEDEEKEDEEKEDEEIKKKVKEVISNIYNQHIHKKNIKKVIKKSGRGNSNKIMNRFKMNFLKFIL